ncbi:GNAT family N-acetyltransferase [Alsobacter sp. SYSU BS001988]
MVGYFGTDVQIRYQRTVHESRDWIASTPGLVNGVRLLSTDDPERLGFEEIKRILDEFGMLGFRCLDPRQAKEWFPRLERLGYRIDQWDMYWADASNIRAKVATLLSAPLPTGLHVRPSPNDPASPETRALQQFLVEQGIAPFSGPYLLDGPRQSTIAIADQIGQIVAAGTTYFPHNRFSKLCDAAFLGLIAVAPIMRGSGLGKAVAARLVQRAAEMSATVVYGQVSRSNEASRRMLAACGLEWKPDWICGLATPADECRFTI